jgi:hypothetical protein
VRWRLRNNSYDIGGLVIAVEVGFVLAVSDTVEDIYVVRIWSYWDYPFIYEWQECSILDDSPIRVWTMYHRGYKKTRPKCDVSSNSDIPQNVGYFV